MTMPTTKRDSPVPSLFAALAFTALSLGASAVHAAPPPQLGGGGSGPEQEACAGRSVGDACTMPNRQLGTCGQGTCNRLDYSQGSPPKAIEEPCVVCQQGGAQGHGDMPALGTDGTPPEDAGADKSTDGKEPPESSSRCRVHDDLDPLALLGLGGLLLLTLVRRRRESTLSR